jgi:hypothetical protein
MKVGDKVRLAHFHGSTGDQILAESGAAGVIKSIEEEPEPNVLTRCVEVQWNDGISWHFRHRLILENDQNTKQSKLLRLGILIFILVMSSNTFQEPERSQRTVLRI